MLVKLIGRVANFLELFDKEKDGKNIEMSMSRLMSRLID